MMKISVVSRRKPGGWTLAAALIGLVPAANAQSPTVDPASPAPAATPELEVVVVTGSLREIRVLDAPYAITSISADELRSAGPMINLSEALVRVPGLTINNRNNYAQDLQISARGFGARAGFGVRGLRVYSDGIPATMPDGQGQVAHFDLAGTERIEVLRGPFSVLYGNSSGGVMALFSAPVRQRSAEAALDIGSFGLRQLRAQAQSPLGGGWEIAGGASSLRVDGFRPHSEATRDLANLRLAWRQDRNRVTLQFSHHAQDADDPLGLTRELFEADPDQTVDLATTYDTRKTIEQTQVGASWRHAFAGDGVWRDITVAAYGGTRGVTQFLAISPAVQSNPSHGGGLVDFDRTYGGLDLRSQFTFGSVDVAAGATVETQSDDRLGYENFLAQPGGSPVLGVRGALRRDERNTARTEELYAQGEWRPTPTLTGTLGVRGGEVTLRSDDAYLDNGDDSGDITLDYTNPVLGLRWQAAPDLVWHASAARGFESPTLGELAYRSDGGGGFNTGLDPQTSRQVETGVKWRGGPATLDATAFLVRTNNEIGVQTNAGGRQSFQNVGRTKRQGLELAAGLRLSAALRAQVSMSWLQARYLDDFLVCDGVPCFQPTAVVPAGNRIAGTSGRSGWAELAWRTDPHGEVAAEWRGVGRTAVNDRNTDFAAGYGIVNLRYSRFWDSAWGRIEGLVRVDNLTDRRYAGSVIVNEANGRFFETAAPRSLLLALRLQPRW